LKGKLLNGWRIELFVILPEWRKQIELDLLHLLLRGISVEFDLLHLLGLLGRVCVELDLGNKLLG
jgi:hypothetical protein